jgi:hypothetical protein
MTQRDSTTANRDPVPGTVDQPAHVGVQTGQPSSAVAFAPDDQTAAPGREEVAPSGEGGTGRQDRPVPPASGNGPTVPAEPRRRAADPGDVPGGNEATWRDGSPGSAPLAGELPDDQNDSFLVSEQRQRLSADWSEVQGRFVDEPRQSVQQADALVVDVMQRVSADFARQRERLEAQWKRGDDVSTEHLRLALTGYRSLFDRLLSA